MLYNLQIQYLVLNFIAVYVSLLIFSDFLGGFSRVVVQNFETNSDFWSNAVALYFFLLVYLLFPMSVCDLELFIDNL